MNKILDRLPYRDKSDSVMVAGEKIPVHAHQIIVWVSVTPKKQMEYSDDVPRLPAILDTGNSFGFSITEHRLINWGNLQPDSLPILGLIYINNQPVNRHAADVWVHCNRPKKRDEFRNQSPFRLELRDGIAVYGPGLPLAQPRLPLLGLRGIDENELRCTIDGWKKTVTLSSRDPGPG